MNTDIQDRAQFDFIRYANVWEDADILCDALVPKPGKKILSIASGGDNALALLAEGADVLAIDLSEAQLAVTELKWHAIKHLPYEKLLAFLGLRSCEDRLETYHQLACELSESTTLYWNNHLNVLQDGVVHQGKFERFFHVFARRILPLVHGKSVRTALQQEKSKAARCEFYQQYWNTWRWRALFKLFFSRFVMGRLGRDPEFFRYVEGSVADKILQRVEYAMTQLPTHNNPYLEYILQGNYTRTLPRYLQPEQVERLKSTDAKLTLFHGSIEAATQSYSQWRFDGYNLSDIFEYLPLEQGQKICEQLVEVSAPNARLVYWNMLAPRRFSKQMMTLEYLAAESQIGFRQDKAFFYSDFVVEEVAHVGE